MYPDEFLPWLNKVLEWREHELRKRQSKFFLNINTLQGKNFTLKVLSEVLFINIFSFFFLAACYPTQML